MIESIKAGLQIMIIILGLIIIYGPFSLCIIKLGAVIGRGSGADYPVYAQCVPKS
jgi:hypothetical protein